jgi:hypothetical protein
MAMNNFKKCTSCEEVWGSREDFLNDPATIIRGYQVHFDELELGYFLFDHDVCGTTLALRAGGFTDLYEGEVYKERLTGTQSCPGYCLSAKELRPCPEKCECAYVRDVIQIVKKWEKLGSQVHQLKMKKIA